MEKIAERIRQGLLVRNMKQVDLVEKTKIGKSSISTYLSGEYEPKQRNIYKIAKALNVSEAWLMGYDVPMEPNDFPSESVLNKPLELTPEQIVYFFEVHSNEELLRLMPTMDEATLLSEYRLLSFESKIEIAKSIIDKRREDKQ